MDELNRIAGKAEALEREFQQAADAGAATEKPSEKQPTAPGPGSSERAENMAESLLKFGEGAAQAFVDQRLKVDGDEVDGCRQSVGPLLDKYGLVASGDGTLPYQEEIAAGFYLGGLWRRFRRTLAGLRAGDKKRQQEREQQRSYGNQREHDTQKQSQSLPSNERLRQEPDAKTEGWNSENWG